MEKLDLTEEDSSLTQPMVKEVDLLVVQPETKQAEALWKAHPHSTALDWGPEQ